MRIIGRRSGRGDSEEKSAKEKQQKRDLTVESAAEMIDSLPSDVPRESQLRIVREAFAAAGIDLSNLERHTRTRGAQVNSEIELIRNRQKELQDKYEELIRALEEEIRQVQEKIRGVQEAFDTALSEEEKKISPPLAALKEVRRVRAFFAFPETEDVPDTAGEEENPETEDVPDTAGEEENPTPLARRAQAKEPHLLKGRGFREARF